MLSARGDGKPWMTRQEMRLMTSHQSRRVWYVLVGTSLLEGQKQQGEQIGYWLVLAWKSIWYWYNLGWPIGLRVSAFNASDPGSTSSRDILVYDSTSHPYGAGKLSTPQFLGCTDSPTSQHCIEDSLRLGLRSATAQSATEMSSSQRGYLHLRAQL